MAWTAPRTWVTDEIITAALLNAQVRDNLLVLSTHAHSGAAGMGASTLSGITFTAVNSMVFADQSGSPSVNGRIQRNGTELEYYDGTTAQNLTQADGTAGTAMLRSLGTSGTTAAAGNHQHEVQFTTDGTEYTNTGQTAAWEGGETSTKSIGSQAVTPAAAASVVAFISAGHFMKYFTSVASAGREGVTATSQTVVITAGGSTIKTVTGISTAYGSNQVAVYDFPSGAAVTFAATVAWTNPLPVDYQTGGPPPDSDPNSDNFINARFVLRVQQSTGSVVTT